MTPATAELRLRVAAALHHEQEGATMRDCPYLSCHAKYGRLADVVLAVIDMPPTPPPRQVECMDNDCDAPGAWHTHPATTPDPIRRKP